MLLPVLIAIFKVIGPHPPMPFAIADLRFPLFTVRIAKSLIGTWPGILEMKTTTGRNRTKDAFAAFACLMLAALQAEAGSW